MKNVKTLFIDPSLNNVGYAIYDSMSHSIIEHECFKSRGNEVQDKLKDIFLWLLSKIKDSSITLAVIEKPATFAYSKVSTKAGKIINLSSLQKLSMAVGCIVGCLEYNGVHVDFMQADRWKGKMPKEHVKAITGIKNEHAADAYLMAVLYYGLDIKRLKEIS